VKKSKIVIPVGLIIILALSFWLYSLGRSNKSPKYKTENVEKGDITATVTATGSVSATTTVAVGSQVSGIISKMYVDFNSNVKKGQLLAELDPTSFQAQVDQRRADLAQVQAQERNSRLAFERAKSLLENQFISRSEYDTAEGNLKAAQAAVDQSQAALKQAETNLSYTRIMSPIDGVVVNRAFDVGQTVAASFQAPTLFTIAQDLTRMQVSTTVDEADIGKIKVGKEATFTVDAFPERVFQGSISQIRLQSTVVQNVVTYPVLIDVNNPDLLLKPGMTANVNIPVETRTDVLKVPNAALRFKPAPEELEERPKGAGGWGKYQKKQGGTTIYTLDMNGKIKSVMVNASITDGAFTAVQSSTLHEGDDVIVGYSTSRAMESSGGMQQRSRRSGGGRPF
jgi:HlyD family secretion protein